jgi:hypothetical protein
MDRWCYYPAAADTVGCWFCLPVLQVIRMGADNMMTVMERAVENGHSVLIENMGESIDAVLNPVITRYVPAAFMYALLSCNCVVSGAAIARLVDPVLLST